MVEMSDFEGSNFGATGGFSVSEGSSPASRNLSLALQGGGAFGAFTWGVLDRLLVEPDMSLDAVSGASAGAVNGVLLAEGLRRGGAPAARQLLDAFWTRLAKDAAGSFIPRGARAGLALDLSSRVLSPYQLNPFNLNPLRTLLGDYVDFAALRQDPPIRLLVSATRVGDGATRIFREYEMSLDAVLASACLPMLQQAVEIDGESYWDGGYAANPPLIQLVEASEATRILLVQIVPTTGDGHPTTSAGIVKRINEITFSTALQHDLDALAAMQRLSAEGGVEAGAEVRKLNALSLHHLNAEAWVPDLGRRNIADLDRTFLTGLRDRGRAAADSWLSQQALAA